MRAVDDVSLDIAAGEFITLLGPSGCGKTTTLRIIAGLAEPDAGTVAIAGRDVTTMPAYRREIGMVFQSHALFPHMTVARNVAFGLRMRGIGHKEQAERVAKALELVHLGGFAARYPSQLSGGQQQRVALARALVISPQVLLLDEPFGALDRRLRETLQVELRQLTRRIGITAVFVTHDQEEALVLSDRIAVMNAGRIEQLGAPAEIFERPVTRFVAEFMGVANILPCRITEIGAAGLALDAGGLRLRAARQHAAGASAGAEIEIAIRSEKIRLLDTEPPPGPNIAAGTLEQAIYLGTTSSYQVRLAARPDLLLGARETNREGIATGPRFSPGAKVWAAWEPEAVHVLNGAPR
ncbi:MAG: ABC transporter ATP-binding protein [Alphaproteobacteria bacterium]|nr:ABC transporter ATP-binding protein [Alphaproteobacteria bacterium]